MKCVGVFFHQAYLSLSKILQYVQHDFCINTKNIILILIYSYIIRGKIVKVQVHLYYMYIVEYIYHNRENVYLKNKLKKEYLRKNFNCILIWFIVFNTTFSNISDISLRPVLVVEEAGVPGENHRPWASNW
jgi:hypothetical protein